MAVRQQGFVLASTLWLLLIMTVGAGFVATWTTSAREGVVEAERLVQHEVDGHNTLHTLLYLLSTQLMTFSGLPVTGNGYDPVRSSFAGEDQGGQVMPMGNEISLDGRPYRGWNQTSFSIQDERGLLALNYVSSSSLDAYLRRQGVAQGKVGELLAKLADYVDPDSRTRLGGAERPAYVETGRPPPPGRYLLTPDEVARVLGWEDLYAPTGPLDRQAFRELTSVYSSGPVNWNTAPPAVLMEAYGLDEESVTRIVERRNTSPFWFEHQVEDVVGRPVAAEQWRHAFFPSSYLRINMWHPDAAQLRQVSVKLAPWGDKGKPWELMYQGWLPLPSNYRNISAEQVASTIFTSPDTAGD